MGVVAVAFFVTVPCAAFTTNAVRLDVLADPAKAAALIAQLLPADTNGDAEVRTDIATLTHYVQRPGAPEAGKRAWCAALEKAVPHADATNAALLIEMLGMLGQDSSVAVLEPLLKDAARKDAACRVLAWIGSPAARAALAWMGDAAQPDPVPDERVLRQIASSAALPAAEAMAAIRPFVAASNSAVACAALTALARFGCADVEALLRAQLAAPRVDVRAHAARLLLGLTYGDPAARAGAVAAPANPPEVLLAFLDHAARRGTAADMPRVCALMAHGDAAVAAAAGETAGKLATVTDVPRLGALLASTNAVQAKAARTALVRVNGAAADSTLALLVADARVVTPALIEVAAARPCLPAAASVTAWCASSNDSLRSAAIAAMASLATTGAMRTVLLPLIVRGTDNDAAAACRSFASAAPGFEAEALRAMPLAEALDDAPPPRKELLVSLLPCMGDAAALDIATSAAAGPVTMRRAVLKALGQWPDAAAADPLISLANSCGDEERGLAFRMLLDLMTRTEMPPDHCAACIRRVQAAATTPPLRHMLAAYLAGVPASASLDVLSSLMDHPDSRAQAVAAMADLVAPRQEDKPLYVPCASDRAAIAKAATAADAATRPRLEAVLASLSAPMPDSEFVPLFNGTNLDGWIGDVEGYSASNGMIVCEPDKGGNIFTAREYDNFHLVFEFRLTPGANNGLGIRTPLEGDPAYEGYEVQILDDTAPEYKDLEPGQYHGSLYKLIPAKRGHLKPVGEWNHEEVIAAGDHVTVMLNGVAIVDGDVSTFGRPERGYIGFLGHGSYVEFRAIKIKELLNIPPRGFSALFNGRDLAGWKGLVGDPLSRAKMTPGSLASAQAAADENMRAHWRAEEGVLVFDGKGDSLCTAREYTNFEMYVDWKIKDEGDSGIYLRGSPQVQIWDTAQGPVGSGGLFNNEKHPKDPRVCADRPSGQWNTFRIRMTGECVSVWLNGTNVVDNVVMENYWDRSRPIFPSGQIELQNHGNSLYFRNIYLKELP